MRGSIVKRPVKSKKDGKPIDQYYIVYDAGMKWDEKKGKQTRNQKWEKLPPPNTRKHAEKLLTERLSQIHKGEFIEPKKITFGEFKEKWLHTKTEIKSSTLTLYHGFLRNHLVPVFGETEISRIEVEDISAFKSAKLDEGLSPQTVLEIMGLLKQILQCALNWEYIRSNPAKKVENPKIQRREMGCLSPEEVRTFLSHSPRQWYAFFLTALTGGLRLGELLAMRWSNIDWNGAQYFVHENLARRRGGFEGGFGKPKTAGSVALVDLPESCLTALREHRRCQVEKKLKAGETYQDHDLIFATAKGTPLNDRNVVKRIFEPTLKAAGLRRVRFHDLRHTCASLLIAQRESPKFVQKQMRHASIQITFDRYGHLFPETNRQAMKKMDETLFGVGGQVAG